jgi:RimJ/RimL family protein N-acetyltransferase
MGRSVGPEGAKLLLRPNAAQREESSMETVQVPTLETERLLLRPFRGSDLDDYADLRADLEVLRYLVGAGGEPWDRGRSSRHMAFMIGHWQVWGSGTWTAEHKESGAFIGIVGFSEPEGWPGLELAWILARRYWGHGYATEAAREALTYAFTTLKRERIISLIHPENRASIRVAERIGETLLDRINHLGQEMLCYGIDQETYLRDLQPSQRAAAMARPIMA